MKKRPLCVICIIVIAVQIIRTIAGDGSPPPASFKERNDIRLTAFGQVYKKEQKSDYQLLYLKDAVAVHQKQQISKLNMIVYEDKFKEISLGNRIIVSGKWLSFEKPRNPGNYNQEFYYAKEGISLAVWADNVEIYAKKSWKIQEDLSVLRGKWHKLLCDVLGREDGGMLSAMMSGERSGLDGEIKELYQVNGIGHLLAISGLHLSFIGLSVYQLLRKAGLNCRKAGFIGIGILAAYAVMTGESVSTVRAFLMFAIRIGADMSGRTYDITTALFLSAAVILCRKPLYVYDSGFLLSFGAVFAIAYFYPFLKKITGCHGKCADGLCAGLSISLFLFPLTMYFFFEIPLYSVMLNLIVIPLMSWLLAIGMIGSFVFVFFPVAGVKILKSSTVIFRIYHMLCENIIRLPGARIVTGQPKWQQAAVCYLLLFVFMGIVNHQSAGKEITGKRLRLGMCCILVLILAISVPVPFEKGRLQAVMLDVGQGDGIFLKLPSGMNCFVDGGSSDVKNVGRYRIEAFLQSQGIGKLDYVFISHGDADHTNGIEEMLKRQDMGVSIENLVLPEKRMWDKNLTNLAKTAFRYGTKVMIIKEKEQITDGKAVIRCILPTKTYTGEKGNAGSMALLLTYGKFDMLLTGDVEGEGEEQLNEITFPNPIEVLKIAHHGSKNSTKEETLERISPQVGLISSGAGNRYGHPHKETLERLKKHKVKIYQTQECGAIKIETDGKSMKIEPFIK